MNGERQIDAENIEKLLELSEERLLLGLGQLLVAEEVIEGDVDATSQAIDNLYGLQPESIIGLMDRARQYLDEQHDVIYHAVCIEWNYCEKNKDPVYSDNITLVSYLIDLLTVFVLKAPITIATVAVILVKKGLNIFCDCKKQAVSESVSG